MFMRSTFTLAYGTVEQFEDAMSRIVPAMVEQGWRLVGAHRGVTGAVTEVSHLWELPDAASLTEAPLRAFRAHPELTEEFAAVSSILKDERLELLAALSYDPSCA